MNRTFSLFDNNNDDFIDFDELLYALSKVINRTLEDEVIPDQLGNLTHTIIALSLGDNWSSEMDFETFKSFWSLFVLTNVQQSIPFQEMYNDCLDIQLDIDAPQQGGLDKGCT